MSDAPASPPWSPTSPHSPPWSPTSPDPARSPAWTEYTPRSPAPSPTQVRATSPGSPAFSPQRESTKAQGSAKAKALAKTLNKHGYDQKTFKALKLKALQTKEYEAKNLRRLDIELEIPPTTYVDTYGKTQTFKVGRRDKKYTRWLPADDEGFVFGEEEGKGAIEKEKKWREEHGWEDLGKKEEKGKGREVIVDVLDVSAPGLDIPATKSVATKRKLDAIGDLTDHQTPPNLSFKVDTHANQAPPAKKVLRDSKSSCMDGRTIRVYQEMKGDLHTPRSFNEKFPGLTYDTVVQRKRSSPDTQMTDGCAKAATAKAPEVPQTAAEEVTTSAVAATIPSSPAQPLPLQHTPAQVPAPKTQAATARLPLPPVFPLWTSDVLKDDFTINTSYTTLITKSQDSSVFSKEDLSPAETTMPHLTKHQRRKLRKRLGIKPPTNSRQRPTRPRVSNYGGTPKGRLPRRGIPDQPRGPKKERKFDCRDGVLGNCPPDCAGRLHKENGKAEQRGKARSKGVLLFGQGAEIGEWHSNEVVGRARGLEGSGRRKGKGMEKGKESVIEGEGESREERAASISS